MPGTFSPAADFKENRLLAIPACTTARAWRTCRDACRDRLHAVTGKMFPAFPAHAHPQFYVSGKRPMESFIARKSADTMTTKLMSWTYIVRVSSFRPINTLMRQWIDLHWDLILKCRLKSFRHFVLVSTSKIVRSSLCSLPVKFNDVFAWLTMVPSEGSFIHINRFKSNGF